MIVFANIHWLLTVCQGWGRDLMQLRNTVVNKVGRDPAEFRIQVETERKGLPGSVVGELECCASLRAESWGPSLANC